MKRLLLSLLSCIAIGQLQAAAKEVTTIGIFIDQPDQVTEEKAIAYDCISAIQDRCSHIFINPTLFKTVLTSLHADALLQEYNIFDTHKGLAYLHSKHDNAHNIGIKAEIFTPLQELTQERIDELGAEAFWIPRLPEFFDLAQWQAYHAQPNRLVMVYMSGHGNPREEDPKFDYCCSMNRLFMAATCKIAHKELAAQILAVKSSFWPAKRILELMQSVHHIEQLPCTIITPMHEEVPVPVSFALLQQGTPSFFAGCRNAAELWHNELTQEVAQHIVNTDTVQLMENQQPTVVLAGTTAAVPLA